MSQNAELEIVHPAPQAKPRAASGGELSMAAPRGAGRRAAGLSGAIGSALEERRLFILLPFAVIAGQIASIEAASSPEGWVLLAVGLALLIALLVSSSSLRAIRVVVVATAFWTGFALFTIHGALFGTFMLSRPVYGTFDATVDEILSRTEGEQRVIVSAISPVDGEAAPGVRRARVFVRAGPELAPGDRIRAAFRFYAVPGPAVPGAFDAQFHGYFDGIGAYATTTKAPEIVARGAETLPSRVIENVRTGIARRVDGVLHEPSAGIARAIINGDQSAVTDAARDLMATAGLAHVLSISGLHLTLVAGGVYFVLRLLLALAAGTGRPYSAKRLAALGGVTSALLYYSISGGNVAALRSTIMILLVLGAVIVGRRALTMRNVAIAGLIVILTDPANVFRPSFQLSFAAVIALVGAYEAHAVRPPREDSIPARALSYFLGIALTSVVAGAATVLFSVYHFQQTSPLSVVGNLITLPLVGFVMMPAALLGVLAMPFGIEALPLTIMGWSVDRMLDAASLVAEWSGGLNTSPLLTPVALCIGLAALAWFAFLQGRWRLLGPALAVPLVIVCAQDRPPDVLVADTTQAVAIRTSDGLRLATGKAASFNVQIWADTYADAIDPMSSGVECDGLGCIAAGAPGFRVAIVKEWDAFGEDCAVADLVVTRLYAPDFCRRETTVVDARDLRNGGVHWLRWDAGRFEIRPAITDLNRPWRASPQ